MSEEQLQQIAQEVHTCTRCPLHQGRVKAVPGVGPANARVMFIGEGPGYHEDRQGLPFVGQAGKFLDELLMMAGMKREEVFIGNVIKCRPPSNRDPEPTEVQTCTQSFLYRQIEVINPRIIVTLGRFSMSLFISQGRITQIHGQERIIDGRLVVPMLHPAAALHQPKNRPLIEEDFRRLPEILARVEADADAEVAPPVSAEQSAIQDDPSSLEQLSMF